MVPDHQGPEGVRIEGMKRALVVIDVQESFRRRPSWADSSNPEIVKPVRRLTEAFRSAGHPVIWVLHEEPNTGTVFDPASGFVRLMDGLEPTDAETVLRKTSHNAFTTTNLQQLLTLAGITELTLCGIRTEQCVETTARIGSDLGYEIVFVTEATATNPIEHWDGSGRTLGVEEIIARTEFALAGRFATIKTVDEVVAGLTGQ
jgi:nicotinamidase-related amidase